MKESEAQQVILETLDAHDAPVPLAALGKRLKVMHRTTAYRALQALEKKGTIRKMTIGGTAMYERNTGEHCHHMTCTGCKKIEHIPFCGVTEMEKEIRKTKEFAITDHAIEFFGVCAACGKK